MGNSGPERRDDDFAIVIDRVAERDQGCRGNRMAIPRSRMRALGIGLTGIDLERYQELRSAVEKGNRVQFVTQSAADRKR